MNTIKIVNKEEMNVRKYSGGRPKGSFRGKFVKYTQAIKPLMVWIRNELQNNNGTIIVNKTDLAKEMSDSYNFVDKKSNTFYWGIKHALSPEGIEVGTVTTNSGDKAIVMKLIGS